MHTQARGKLPAESGFTAVLEPDDEVTHGVTDVYAKICKSDE